MRRKVVVVDDNSTMRRFAVDLLQAQDTLEVVEQHGSGMEVVAATRQDCPDVIVLDHEMPHGTGLSVLPLLRQECPGARIVMWSTSTDIGVIALELGADAVVDKAEPLAALLTAVLD